MKEVEKNRIKTNNLYAQYLLLLEYYKHIDRDKYQELKEYNYNGFLAERLADTKECLEKTTEDGEKSLEY